MVQISDGSVVSFQKTAVAVLFSACGIFKNRVCGCNAVVPKLSTAVAVITYNFNSTKN